jgi:hypothetical protein
MLHKYDWFVIKFAVLGNSLYLHTPVRTSDFRRRIRPRLEIPRLCCDVDICRRTLWCYLLSRGIELIKDKFIDHGPAEQPLVPKSEARKHG